MVNIEFAEATAELNMILKYLPIEYIEKIPNKLMNFFNTTASPTYQFEINPNKSLEEQNIKEKTKDLIAILYINYWCNDEEKIEINQKIMENDRKYEEQLREKYNYKDVFNNKNVNCEISQEDSENPKEISMMEYKESFFKRMINKIKNFFHL